ncbi:hypothetical protein GCM10022242_05930 [Nocardioides panacisoli]|uniref:Uncharacterized protein n=1 Tax=Nocardioides panacisoli TaxID=627624 RepID=A0ABP7HXR4_9ACTN
MNLRLVVDSQRLLSAGLAPYAARIDEDRSRRWQIRAETYARVQQQLRDIGGHIGRGELAAGEGANAVARLKALPRDLIVEPRVLAGFQTLFDRIDVRIAYIVEEGVERGAFVQRVQVPRLVEDSGQLVHPVRERFVPVAPSAELPVIATVRSALRPQLEPQPSHPGPSRAGLHAALIHRPADTDRHGLAP